MSKFQIIAVSNGRSIDASESIFEGTKSDARLKAAILGGQTRCALKDPSARAFVYLMSGCVIASKVGEF